MPEQFYVIHDRATDRYVYDSADFLPAQRELGPFETAERFIQPRDNMLRIFQRLMPDADLHWIGPCEEGKQP